MEEWKNINGFDGYQISNYGNVRNKNGVLLIGYIAHGYHKVKIRKQHLAVHRLVAEYFLEHPTQEQLTWAASTVKGVVHVNHKDSNKLNNHVDNLEWNTASENITHSFKHGNAIPNITGAKLTPEQITEIRNSFDNYSGTVIEYAREVCSKYNVSRRTIRRILYNETWKE